MNMLSKVSDIARSPGDPTVIETGPSARGVPDSMAQGLGWFSMALGMAELVAAERLTRALGMEGKESLVRAFGAREIMSGMLSLSVDRTAGIWSRVAGDALDIGVLMSAHTDDNPKKRNVAIALGAVAGVTVLDAVCAVGLTARHGRGRGEPRDYSDRSGWPKGAEHSRGAARDFRVPDDMKAFPVTSYLSPATGDTSSAYEAMEPAAGRGEAGAPAAAI
jgi:hypothetical protein